MKRRMRWTQKKVDVLIKQRDATDAVRLLNHKRHARFEGMLEAAELILIDAGKAYLRHDDQGAKELRSAALRIKGIVDRQRQAAAQLNAQQEPK